MKRKYVLIFCLCFNSLVQAQELFVLTEPASNMAAKSLGFRAMNSMMRENKWNRNKLSFNARNYVGY
jgi:hypothetical protein